MKVVLTAVGYVFLQPGYLDAGLVTVCRTFLFAAQTLLKQLQTVKASLQVLRIAKCASVRTYGKRFDTQINTQSRIVLYGCC